MITAFNLDMIGEDHHFLTNDEAWLSTSYHAQWYTTSL